MNKKSFYNWLKKINLFAFSIVLVLANNQAWAKEFKPTRPGEVYLLRGLANVFSLGMDEMGKKFRKIGIESEVYNHAHW